MRRKIAYPLVALGMTVGSTLTVASPVLAHGYVSTPPSRQALCAAGTVKDCGPIQFEPQSVEAPKGANRCDGGVQQWSVLSDESRNWPARPVGSSVTFTWVLTARHRTADFVYFVGGTQVARFDGGNAQPDAVVTHTVDMSKFPGRRTVLAVWNIGDTINAFYSCVDLNVGGGAGAAPTAAPTTGAPAPAPTATKPTAAPTSAPAKASGTWAAGTSYRTGDEVTFNGVRYQCRQSHTSINSWEPSIYTLALWLPL
ncbi:lytic polysaccharide monooxygenase [Paractinoplanes rishiriensis]|uniref:Cellulose-binding protein n=1 Tax=Paractinoplanes rishiriensis TaxID=1050105 RepID=A0A919K0L2_9ACTN|nr:lytic polysaccharide monooxygenase [Actinoplanes rishiriensis]GIE96634.1 cellulose-binding protein [Actinoplanes rishiriensis]